VEGKTGRAGPKSYRAGPGRAGPWNFCPCRPLIPRLISIWPTCVQNLKVPKLWKNTQNVISVQSYLENDRIADLSPRATANGFVWFWPHIIMVPWIHKSQSSNGISIGSGVFAQNIRVTSTQTHRHTDTQTMLRATSVAIGRILCTECKQCSLNLEWLAGHSRSSAMPPFDRALTTSYTLS